MAAVATPPHGRPELKRELGLGMTTAMVVGNMIGSGVFLLPASLAAVVLVYGSSSLLAWVVTGVGAKFGLQEAPVACLIALCATAVLTFLLFFQADRIEALLQGIFTVQG